MFGNQSNWLESLGKVDHTAEKQLMTPQSVVNSASNILLLALPGMSLTLFHESLQKGGFSTFVENLYFNHIR